MKMMQKKTKKKEKEFTVGNDDAEVNKEEGEGVYSRR